MEAKKATLLECNFSREWNGPKGMIYYFNLKWDNGDEGEMSTNRIKKDKETGKVTQTKFVIGAEQQYTAETKTSKKTGNDYLFFDKFKEPYNPGAKKSFSQRSDPHTQIRIVRTVALKAAIKSQIFNFPESMNDVANTYIDWIKDKGLEQDKAIPAQSAIAEAITFYEVRMEKPEELKDILGLAEKFYKFITKKYE